MRTASRISHSLTQTSGTSSAMRKIILSSHTRLFAWLYCLSTPAMLAQDRATRVVEPIPAASTDNLYRVSADRTPVGF